MTHTATGDVTLRAADAELTIEPARGCRFSSLQLGGVELLRSGEGYGAYVMAPWCGRLERDQFRDGGTVHQLPTGPARPAVDGTVRDARWRTVRVDARSAAFSCALAAPWPYPGLVSQLVELAEDGSGVTLTVGVEAVEDSFPAQVGWRPWFRRNLGRGGQDVRIACTADGRPEPGQGQSSVSTRTVPRPGPGEESRTGTEGVDATLTWPAELELRMTSRTSWLVVRDEQPEAVCVEPWSGPPNGLNAQPRLVTPIDPLELSTRWSWRRR